MCVVSPVSHGGDATEASYAGAVTAAALTSPAAAARTVTTVRTDDAGALLDRLPGRGRAVLGAPRRGAGRLGRGRAAGGHRARTRWPRPPPGGPTTPPACDVDDDLGVPGSGPGPVRQHRLRPGGRDVGLRRPRGRRRTAGRRRLGDHRRRRRPARRARARDRRTTTPPLRLRYADGALDPATLVRRRRHRGRSGSAPASWPRSCWPATCWSPPTCRSTRAGCCAGWPPASPTAGPSPSTACSAPPRSCCCGAPAGELSARVLAGTAPAGRGRRGRAAGRGAASARPRTAPSTRSPSTRWSRALEPVLHDARRPGRARAAHAGQRAAPGQRRHRHPAPPRPARRGRAAGADRRRAPDRGRLRHADPRTPPR